MHTVVETPGFVSDAKAAGLTEDERTAITDFIALRPTVGVVIPGARKLRFAGRGKGQERRVSCDHLLRGNRDAGVPAELVVEGERADISQAERNTLRVILGELADEYRRGVKSNVQGR